VEWSCWHIFQFLESSRLELVGDGEVGQGGRTKEGKHDLGRHQNMWKTHSLAKTVVQYTT
jgi:hypothetical protein